MNSTQTKQKKIFYRKPEIKFLYSRLRIYKIHIIKIILIIYKKKKNVSKCQTPIHNTNFKP